MSSLSLVSELDRELPESIPFAPRNGSELYGAADVAAAYCGIRPPYPPPPKPWAHGWIPTYIARDAAIVREYLALHRILYGREEDAFRPHEDGSEFARAVGRTTGKAIGLPLVYLPEILRTRIPGSLLVLPVHSHDGERYQWQPKEYAEAIDGVRGDFSRVVVCIHPACIRNGYWVHEFRALGFDVISGADSCDANGLRRVQALFSTFEYVTTNGFGSHLAYAAYWGAKVSIWGPYTEATIEDARANNPANCPPGNRFMEMLTIAESKPVLRRHYPFLFGQPLQAETRVEWAREEVGQENKLSPGEMRNLFHWGDSELLRWRLLGHPVAEIKNGLRRFLPQPVKQWVKAVIRPEGARKHRVT